MSGHPDITVVKDAERLGRLAAATLSELIIHSIDVRGGCTVALAGGKTPRRVYEILAAEPLRSSILWRHVHVFFGDERMVPPDDPSSNFGMVYNALVRDVPIPKANIHRIRGEVAAVDAAREYETELRKHFDGQVPCFDIVLLGVGEDGHTASLFPGTEALKAGQDLAVGCFVPQLASWRVTMTLPVFINARETLFLAAGKPKAPVIAKIMAAREPRMDLPASMVRPVRGRVRWMLDEAAASMLSPGV